MVSWILGIIDECHARTGNVGIYPERPKGIARCSFIRQDKPHISVKMRFQPLTRDRRRRASGVLWSWVSPTCPSELVEQRCVEVPVEMVVSV